MENNFGGWATQLRNNMLYVLHRTVKKPKIPRIRLFILVNFNSAKYFLVEPETGLKSNGSSQQGKHGRNDSHVSKIQCTRDEISQVKFGRKEQNRVSKNVTSRAVLGKL